MNIRPKTVRRLVILLAACGVIAAAVASILSYTRHSQETQIQTARTDGMNAYNNGDYAAALDKLHFYISKHQDDYDAKYALAVARNHVETASGRHLIEAKELFEELHSERPDDMRVSHNLLELYDQIGYSTEGTHLADEVLARDPRIDVLRTKSAALAQANKLSDAVVVSQKLNDVAPLDLDGQIQTLDLLRMQKRPANEIVSHFQALQQAHPNDARFEMLVGLAYSNAQDEPNTLKWLRSAAQRTPPDAQFVRRLSRYFDNLKLFDESRQLLERAVAGGNHPEIVKVLVERLWENGRFAEVTDRLKDLDPGAESSDADLLAFKALSLEELGRRNDEDAIVQAMKQREHNNKAAAWALAMTTHDDPNIAQRDAIKQYEIALSRDRDNAIVRCWIGESYSRLGEMELATQQWRQSAELMPSWAHPCVLLAREELSKDQVDDALRNAADAIRRAPNLVESGVVMALALYRHLGRPSANHTDVEGLIVFIGDIQKGAPGERETLPLLADLEARDGKRDEAIATIHTALSKPEEKSDTDLVLRLADVNRRQNLGLDQEIAAALPSDISTSPRLALEEAMNLARAGKTEDGLNLLNKAATSATSQPVKWKLARAQYLESINDPAAKAAWIELGDGNPDDIAIQNLLLTVARSASSDRDFFKRTIDRVHALTGDDALGWKLADARYLLTSDEKERDSAAAVVILKSLVDASPDTPEYRVLLAAGLMNLGNTSGAIEHLKAAVDHDPAGVDTMIELTKLLLSQDRADEARGYLDRAAKSPGLTPANRKPLAILLARQGATQQAIDVLQPVSDSLGSDGQLILAELLRKQGQSNEAEAIYTSLLNHPPTSAEAIASAADFYASTNRLDQGKQILSRLSDPTYPPTQRALLIARFNEIYVSKDSAHQQLQNATNEAPDNPTTWQALVEFDIRQNDFDDAIASADKALAKLPDSGILKTLKAQATALKSTTAGQTDLRPLIDALSKDPRNSAQVEVLKTIQDARENQLSPEQMAEKLKSIADKYPSYYPLQAQLAQAYLSLGQTNNAATVVERLMETRPNDPDAAKLAVNVYRAAQRWREMKRAASQWKERTMDKPMDADIAQAEASLSMGDVKAASDELAPYIQQAKDQPQHAPALTAIVARWLIASDRAPEARTMLQPLLNEGQAWRRMWLLLAAKYVSPAPTAAEWIRTASAVVPDNSIEEKFIVAQSWQQMGMRLNDKDATGLARDLLQGMVDRSEAGAQPAMILASLDTDAGDLVGAEALYRKAIKLDPNLPDAMNNLAYILLEKNGDLNEAKDLASRAIAKQPTLAAFHDTLARIDEKLNSREQSLTEFQEALRLEPENLDAHIGLTRVLSADGHRDKAEMELQRIESQLKGAPPPANESTRKELESLRVSLSSTGAGN